MAYVEPEDRPKNYDPSEYGTTFGGADFDYITATTFNKEVLVALEFCMPQDATGVQDTFRGYVGRRYGQIRFLEGEQNGRWHGIIIGEGNACNWVMDALTKWRDDYQGMPLWQQCNFTRIDVQCSALDTFTHFRKLKDNLQNPLSEWRRRGPKPKVSLIEGTKTARGLGKTIYVGSQKTKSGKFIRIYEKPDSEGNRWLRFEAQFKGKRANEVATAVLKHWGSYGPTPVLAGVLGEFPEYLVQNDLSHIWRGLGPSGAFVEPSDDAPDMMSRARQQRRKDIKRALWFRYDVSLALTRIESDDVLDWLQEEFEKMSWAVANKANRLRRMESFERALKMNEDTQRLELERLEEERLQEEEDMRKFLAERSTRPEEYKQLPLHESLISANDMMKRHDNVRFMVGEDIMKAR